MPWKSNKATSFTKKATTPKLKNTWSKIANNVLKSGGSDASAIKIANSAISKSKKK